MDAVSYVVLGRVFTANMTGNTVLLGIAVGRMHGAEAARSAIALGGFSLGAVAGSALRTPREAFALELAALAAAAVVAGVSSAAGARLPAIALAAAAMGIQSATLRRRNETGVNVTYLTGTVTTLWARVTRVIARGHSGTGPRPALPLVVWIAYGTGGACGALAGHAWGSAALALPIAAIALAGVTWPASREARVEPR